MAPSSDRSDHHTEHKLSADTIHDLQTSLTVIKGQAQLVRRWVRRSDIVDAEPALARLDVIESVVTRLVAEIDRLHQAA